MLGSTPPPVTTAVPGSVGSSGSHQRSGSSEFGDFHSAPLVHASPSPKRTLRGLPSMNQLDETDLLGSFDEVDEMEVVGSAPPSRGTHQGAGVSVGGGGSGSAIDLFDEPAGADTSNMQPLRRLTSRSSVGGSPTKSRYWASEFPGPGSPPRVTDAHIVVHAPQGLALGSEAGYGNGNLIDDASLAASSPASMRLRRMSNEYTASGRLPLPASNHSSPHPSVTSTSGAISGASTSSSTPLPLPRASPHVPSFSDLFATKHLGQKWKRSVLGNLNGGSGGDEGPTKTAIPIDITHKSPFANVHQIPGTYVAPDGAPGFVPGGEVGRHDEDNDEFANTSLGGRGEMTQPVLSLTQAKELRALLPARHQLSDRWNLLFSLDQHGASLSTLYRLTEKYAKDHRTNGNLLVVQDGEGHIFGVFLNEPIIKREGTYYGSGESFMFKFERGKSKPRVFRWTARNQYIALCESSFISFGGGGNSYGLILDASFSRCSSATAPSFDNEVLCVEGTTRNDKAHLFDCIGLEVWGTA